MQQKEIDQLAHQLIAAQDSRDANLCDVVDIKHDSSQPSGWRATISWQCANRSTDTDLSNIFNFSINWCEGQKTVIEHFYNQF